jgi:hypothetical protein
MLNVSATLDQLTNDTYNFGNTEAGTIMNISSTVVTNFTYHFWHMEANNVEHLCDHGAVSKCHLYWECGSRQH